MSGIADPKRIKKTTSRRVIFTLYLHAAVAATGQCTTLSGMSGCLYFSVVVQSEQKQESSSRIPVSERAFVRAPIRARFWREWADQRASRGEGPCVLLKAAKQKVSPGYSPADDSAGSLTPVEMTLRNGLAKREKFKLYHYPFFKL